MTQRLAWLFATLSIGLLICACAPDIEDERGAGQQCTSDDDCEATLSCFQRTCVAGPEPIYDADFAETDTDVTDTQQDTDESSFDCTPGDTRCESEQTIERCVASAGEDPYWSSSSCPPEYVCDNGQCVDETNAEDCCPGGCGDDEICHNCSCTAYDPDECTFQDQPCSTEGRITNGFSCVPLLGTDDLRCLGLCNPGADAPDETCPGDNTVCQFEDPDQSNGHCLTNCEIGDPCADDWMTCIYNDSAFDDGLCQAQTDTRQPGEPCDSAEPFSCAGDAICTGGFCHQTCRPFTGDDQSDCQQGHCLAIDANWGICTDDSSLDDSECTAPSTTCGADATICVDESPQDSESPDYSCRNMCRPQVDDQDCTNGDVCEPQDPDNPVIGHCVQLSPP